VLPPGSLPHDDVERAVANVARYDIQELSEAWLRGDAARTLRIVDGLRSEGEPITLVAWQLGEDLHALAAVHEAVGRGQSVANAMRNVRVWGKRQPALERAARRIDAASVLPRLASLAKLDAQAKGLGHGDPWDAVVATALSMCEQPAPVEP
jgi:DNA polymerase-3 subunit delta